MTSPADNCQYANYGGPPASHFRVPAGTWSSVENVPSLSEWGMLALAALLAGAAGLNMRRKMRPA